MTKEKRKNQIFIFGYYGYKNTGDDAILYALLYELYKISPSAIFAILSNRSIFIPPKIRNRVKFVKSRRLNIFKEIFNSDIFIMGGGTQIHDKGTILERMKILFEIFIILIWAKIFCKKIYFICIGVECSTVWGKLLSKQICRLANFISVRDYESYKLLKYDFKLKNVIMAFDLAVLLKQFIIINNKKYFKNRKILGISILPYFELYELNKEKEMIFLNKIAMSLNKWIKQNSNNYVYLFIFKDKYSFNDHGDYVITFKLKKLINMHERVRIIFYNSNPLETLKMIAQCDYFIGMRYHSCLFAYIAGIPLIIISYSQKCRALGNYIGLSDDAIITPEIILKENLINYIYDLQKNPNKYLPRLPIEFAVKKAKNGLPVYF